ncbi:hypothetical protein FGO68_gene5034 [Halteria grandinella]|uniref:Uncharacterized protein n=1 Tax=Halteria grandinella TaxID=5974 RepID=A0A8J8P8T5_HALGN|nr:hypothetical protein FGO68_gene5034 [Halteria grandinella]
MVNLQGNKIMTAFNLSMSRCSHCNQTYLALKLKRCNHEFAQYSLAFRMNSVKQQVAPQKARKEFSLITLLIQLIIYC